MRPTRALTIELSPELAEMVEAKVRSGEYASESEVIHDGLLALADREAAMDRWIADDVLPALDALDADPKRAVSATEAWSRIESHMDQRSDRKSAGK
ncbi:type II toxin-antitoxin system ParD family antitoxin [Pseudomonas sp. R2.Fl]|nr:type II toxin-antitoxin system ParD family antitoxin [Pseudomonas sp. R2.Fl]